MGFNSVFKGLILCYRHVASICWGVVQVLLLYGLWLWAKCFGSFWSAYRSNL